MLNVSTHFTLAFLISEILSFVKLTRKALFWFHILVEKNQNNFRINLFDILFESLDATI